ncbi:Type I phosphodiesterase / nucleotide pyrophosphatase [Mucilaginibacter gossypiicola]|uniref:Type I phosphodiesterase / nucleotide pyrophosphatase n=1 Tax=Mucilaginibacter gossypiicola TaxID=551995 RepID=A0A1H8NQN0_9SPHI|nr:alkaline phosphatase family protein [Mucilaginibacter gossypiicola]SEO31954.1 Type I phosphodiesterase / nucleotide pyrophosphatase [Mucilaginibacter gossypiicola]
MRLKSIICIAACLSLSAIGFAQQRQKKVVYVIADGVPADVMERVELPNLKKIIDAGSYLRIHVGGDKGTYNETPTISAVGYNSLLTGTWVNKHNVPDNDITAPNYNYKHIFEVFKTQYPNKKTGIFSSWTDNRTKLLGDGLAATGNFKPDYAFDGYELDTVRFKHDKKSDYMHLIDEEVVKQAANTIQTKAPDLSWVYLEYTDDMGHRYGDSPEFYKAVSMLDIQMGKLWDAITYRQKNYKEDWLIVITTDHGRDERTGKGHGGQSERQRSTWMVSNYKNLNTYAQYFDVSIVDIMPSIARYLDVKLPESVKQEIDGTPFIGPVSVTALKVNYIQDHLDISWRALEKTGKVKVWLATTNNFKTSGKDEYHLLGEVDLTQQHYFADLKDYPSEFYKIIVEGADNSVNKWVNLKK